ncbi:hypothetical protein ABEV74_19440, partial [Paenibacillus cisolokensis]|uniref:hypothetical protein n=1 Tax=Paenibacillus cisolokensis TaxID=1658519 RepID=UPI003D2C46A1
LLLLSIMDMNFIGFSNKVNAFIAVPAAYSPLPPPPVLVHPLTSILLVSSGLYVVYKLLRYTHGRSF